MPDRQSIRYIPPLFSSLDYIARKCSEYQLITLEEYIYEISGYSTSEEHIVSLSKKLDLEDIFTRQLILALEHIYLDIREEDEFERERSVKIGIYANRIYADNLSPDDLFKNIDEYDHGLFESELKILSDILQERLARLVRPNSLADNQYKAAWLKTGMIPTAVESATFVDVRSDFNRDRSAITGNVVTLMFRIITASDVMGEDNIVFQVTEEGLKSLKTTILDAEKKVELVRKQFNI